MINFKRTDEKKNPYFLFPILFLFFILFCLFYPLSTEFIFSSTDQKSSRSKFDYGKA